MSCETTLYVLGVRVAPDRRAKVSRLIQQQRRSRNPGLAYLFKQVDFTPEGSLELRGGADSDEVPDDLGFVCSIWGKFNESEAFANWLCRHCDEGTIIQHSREGDGAAWGWEFKNGRIRHLELRPAASWIRLGPPSKN